MIENRGCDQLNLNPPTIWDGPLPFDHGFNKALEPDLLQRQKNGLLILTHMEATGV